MAQSNPKSYYNRAFDPEENFEELIDSNTPYYRVDAGSLHEPIPDSYNNRRNSEINQLRRCPGERELISDRNQPRGEPQHNGWTRDDYDKNHESRQDPLEDYNGVTNQPRNELKRNGWTGYDYGPDNEERISDLTSLPNDMLNQSQTRDQPRQNGWTSNNYLPGNEHGTYLNNPYKAIEDQSAILNDRRDHWNETGTSRRRKGYTMKNAREIAAQLRVLNRDEIEAIAQEPTIVEEDNGKKMKRKCWGRSCWSKSFHSHAKRRIGPRTRLQQTPVSPATGLSALELNKQKARKRLRETWKDVTGRLYIWSQSLKTIEGRYGTGVVSYFIFLRWLLFLNIFICALVVSFIVLPQALAKHNSENDTSIADTSYYYLPQKAENHSRPILYEGSKLLAPEELRHILYASTPNPNPQTTLVPFASLSERQCYELYKSAVRNRTRPGIETGAQDLLQGTGFMEITLLFPGFYDPAVPSILDKNKPYNLSLAYIFVTLSYFLVCLIMMVIYTSEGVHETLKTSEGQLHKYCNLVFGGWDYCIEQKKTATRKQQSISQELKSTLFEKRRQNEVAQWSRKTQFVVFLTRCLLHIIVIAVLSAGGYVIYIVCIEALDSNDQSREGNDFDTLLIEFLPSITITLLNLFLPIVFTQIAKFEKYSVAFTIKITLVRTVFVRLASVGVLVWTFYVQFTCKDSERDPQCKYCANKEKLVPRCWETYVGQQLYKLVILDFVVVLVTTFLIDFPRRLIYTNCSCKLAKIVGPLEFDIPKHVLDLVYSQTLCWLGTFYSPLLPAICVIKYIVFFYLKKLTLLVNCSPSQIPYRASKSNTFFMIVLMLSFVLSVIPVGYTIAEIPPSKGCGPFRGYDSNMWNPVKHAVDNSQSTFLKHALNYLASAGFAVPLFVILCLFIYYYSTVSSAHKDMIKVLKDQLVLEGKDKQFLLARLTEDAKQRLRSGGSLG